MTQNNKIIELKNVWVSFEGQIVLEDINLSIRKEDFLGIIGPNGAGKTTLLRLILGLIQSDRGEVLVFGRQPKDARKFIGYVPQTTVFDKEFPISAWEVVLLGRLNQVGWLRRFNPEDKKFAEEALKTVGMWHLKDKQIGQLSGGQRQRIFIARAITQNPKLLILDEPTASVDKPMQVGVYDLLEKLKKEMTIILVSHDIGAVASFVNKIACLNRKLFYHDSKEITAEHLEAVYECPVDLIAHGVPHRILKEHKHP